MVHMSGLETVKIIVDAEKEAAKILNEAQAKASEIRKQADVDLKPEKEVRLSKARTEAALLVQNAEVEGKSEALRHEEESRQKIKDELEKASAHRAAAVKALFDIVLG